MKSEALISSFFKFFLVERHIDLMMIEPLLVFSVFVLDHWLVVPRQNEFVWFDKMESKRIETSTVLNNTSEVFLSDSSLLFVVPAIVNDWQKQLYSK